MVDRAGRDVLRTGRHRPICAVRTAGDHRADGARRGLGRPARGTARAMGANAHALPPRSTARLPGGLVAEQRPYPAGRRRGVPDRGYKAGSGQRRSADGDRRGDTARRSGHPILPRGGRRPLALLTGVDRRLRQHRSAAHAAVAGNVGGVMILDLGDEAKEFGRQALRAFEAAGGDDLLQRAEAKPDAREGLVTPVLSGLGAWELDVRTDPDSLEAAAALCRSAGYWALPYPVAERLARPADLDVDGLIVVAGATREAPLGGLDNRWAAVTLDGNRSSVVRLSTTGPAFTAALELSAVDADGAADVALALVLPCWTLLGMLDRAIELTVNHVRLRKQFGQPLSTFQGVQFQLTDAEVERSGLDILAKHALWSSGTSEGLHDALALRLAAVEAAEVVFRVCHQLHGAVGFCDETTLSWLSRYSQPLRRLPLGLSATRYELARRLGGRALTGLFS